VAANALQGVKATRAERAATVTNDLLEDTKITFPFSVFGASFSIIEAFFAWERLKVGKNGKKVPQSITECYIKKHS
jgi:hypothetical protein